MQGFTILGDGCCWCDESCIVGPEFPPATAAAPTMGDSRSSAAAAAAAAAAATALSLPLFAAELLAAALRELNDWCKRLPAPEDAPTPPPTDEW